MAKVYILKENEITAVENIQKAIDVDPTFRYKAEKEPLFQNIAEYLEGMQMISTAQMKLEQEIDEKVKEKYEKESNHSEEKEVTQTELENIHFNYFYKFHS